MVSFAPCILINAKKLRRVELLLFIQVQSFSFQFLQCHRVETLLHEAGADSSSRGDMRKRLSAGQLADLLAQTRSRLPAPATRRIRFASRLCNTESSESGVSAGSLRRDALARHDLVSFWVAYHEF